METTEISMKIFRCRRQLVERQLTLERVANLTIRQVKDLSVISLNFFDKSRSSFKTVFSVEISVFRGHPGRMPVTQTLKFIS